MTTMEEVLKDNGHNRYSDKFRDFIYNCDLNDYDETTQLRFFKLFTDCCKLTPFLVSHVKEQINELHKEATYLAKEERYRLDYDDEREENTLSKEQMYRRKVFDKVSHKEELKDDIELQKKIIDIRIKVSYREGWDYNDIDSNPELFEYYVQTSNLRYHKKYDENYNFKIRNEENALKNLDTLAKYAPYILANKVYEKRKPKSSTFHYLAELHTCKIESVSLKIISLTPRNVLEEILESGKCKYKTFLKIIDEISKRSPDEPPFSFYTEEEQHQINLLESRKPVEKTKFLMDYLRNKKGDSIPVLKYADELGWFKDEVELVKKFVCSYDKYEFHRYFNINTDPKIFSFFISHLRYGDLDFSVTDVDNAAKNITTLFLNNSVNDINFIIERLEYYNTEEVSDSVLKKL